MKKVLSFVLILALVLGSFSMAFAADTKASTLSDIAGLPGQDVIQVCYDLGVITGNPDGTYDPGKAVNRAEFAALITRIMGIPESALAGYQTANFNDTVGYGWAVPYLAFCQSKGIMLGDGYGNAMPGRTITITEAVTMIMRALGYVANSAELVGTWPSNYVTIAQKAKLFDGVADEVTVTKESAAQLLYNALTVQKVAVNADGTTNDVWVTQPTTTVNGVEANFLNTGLGCYGVPMDLLDDDYFGNTVINFVDRFGLYGTAYLKDKTDELVAFRPDDNSTLLTGYVTSKGKFNVGGKEYSFGTGIDPTDISGVPLYSNAEFDTVITGPGLTSIAAIEDASDYGEVTLSVDLSGLTIRDIYGVVAWAANDADQAATADVTGIEEDQDLFGSDFVLDDDQEIDLKQFKLDGVASLSDIAADDVVYVYADSDGDIRKIAVGQTTVEGNVDEMVGDENFTVNGEELEYAAHNLINPGPADDENAVEVGSDAVVNVDAYGFAFAIDSTGGTVKTFGMVQGTTDETTMDDGTVKLYTSDDATKKLTLVAWDKLKIIDIDGIRDITPNNRNDVNQMVSGTVLQLIGYKLNKDGLIKEITLSDQGDPSDYVRSASVAQTNGASKSIERDAVVFTIDNSGADPKYGLSDPSSIDYKDSAANKQEMQTVLNKDGKIIALTVDVAIGSSTKDNVYAVINSVSTLANDIQRYQGFADGAALDIKSTDIFLSNADVKGGYNPVLFELERNASGTVKDVDDNGFAEFASGTAVTKGVDDSAKTIEVTSGAIRDTLSAQSDVVVYKAVLKSNGTVDKYQTSKFSSIKAGSVVYFYDTKDVSDQNDIATVVIWCE